ncbi:YfbM family protein [Thiothrix lacustris]|uniref:YfbM family protein n=1 Tax=Thiothrix lacustris TaxID=525917 RepID=UPI0027E402A6|nr:YfbM family protein [Thiothrix lacustris]WMP17559.1 YfbM family protein [Thiothrix lacustris]
MGVHLHLSATSDLNISRLKKNPTLIWNVVFADQFNAMRTNPNYLAPRHALEPEPLHLRETLGEYWHGIHYLMCGQGWNGDLPDAFLIDGGSYVGDVDIGYGPARVFESCEVKRITQSITKKTAADLTKNFDTNQMLDDEIYPQIWDGNDHALDACLSRFKAMQHFMHHAAENNLGMTVYLSKTPELTAGV